MKKTNYKAIKYIRLSDADGNLGESDSVANQRRLIDEYIKRYPEIEVVGEKVDDGYTGIDFERPAFEEMMVLIREGKVNCCITKDLSRLGREYIETNRYLREIFPRYGVRYIAINDNIDTLTTKGDGLDVSIKTISNDAYSLDISKKTRSAIAAKQRSGECVSAFPVYGYKKSPNNRNQLIIDDYAAGIVREIFNMKLDGYSNLRIIKTLNERGILSPIMYKKHNGLPYAKNGYGDYENAKWSVSTILRLLKNETYIGTLVQGKSSTPNYKLDQVVKKPQSEWTRFENAHEPIIDKYKFDITQRIMKLDTRTSPKDDKLHIFSGLLICGSCGTRMTHTAVPYKDGKYSYFKCPRTKKRGCKNGVMVREEDLTEQTLKYIKDYIMKLTSLDRLLKRTDAERIAREHAAILTEELNKLEHELAEIRNAEASLYTDMVKSLITRKEYNSYKVDYAKDAEILVKSIERLKKKIDGILLCNNERLEWIGYYRQFENISELNRKTVINFINYIKVNSKTEFVYDLNMGDEFKTALAIVERGGFDGSQNSEESELCRVSGS